MFRPQDVPWLQKAADDAVVRRGFKSIGIVSMIFGLLALFGAIAPPLDPFLLLVGSIVTVAGLWSLTIKSPTALLLSAIAIALVGTYNLASPFMAVGAGAKASTGWAVLGVWQLVWSWQGYRRWQRFRGALQSELPAHYREFGTALVEGLYKAKVKRESDVVDFVAVGFMPTLMRLRLGPEIVACLVGGGSDILIVPRAGVSIELERASGKMARGTLVLGGRRCKGQLKSDQLERFRQWETGARAATAIAA